jgi:hypothetical protein
LLAVAVLQAVVAVLEGLEQALVLVLLPELHIRLLSVRVVVVALLITHQAALTELMVVIQLLVVLLLVVVVLALAAITLVQRRLTPEVLVVRVGVVGVGLALLQEVQEIRLLHHQAKEIVVAAPPKYLILALVVEVEVGLVAPEQRLLAVHLVLIQQVIKVAVAPDFLLQFLVYLQFTQPVVKGLQVL